MSRFAGWLRHNSEAELIAATQAELAQRYLGREGPLREDDTRGGAQLFWQGAFVPVYRRLPWSVRRLVMRMLPGSHRRRWRT